jgi:hypothetical protein
MSPGTLENRGESGDCQVLDSSFSKKSIHRFPKVEEHSAT